MARRCRRMNPRQNRRRSRIRILIRRNVAGVVNQ
jgi:hypothetical protein